MTKELTEAQEAALDIIKTPAYDADGTTIPDGTGYALCCRDMAVWDGKAWQITDKGREYVENNL